ncbi:hypothetical protein EDB81DRAFT_161426 [Dactylonectria macrodidyma]|uniref:Uncharacterized protein n=1 Tax=Dactylonectria macrodidyma TaxID=307937 RepID=A0A9P9FPR9_9HYPO|nr:hypothetical protein EDB81DRAFT_161426 [Dactylonectria macrodidyma]
MLRSDVSEQVCGVCVCVCVYVCVWMRVSCKPARLHGSPMWVQTLVPTTMYGCGRRYDRRCDCRCDDRCDRRRDHELTRWCGMQNVHCMAQCRRTGPQAKGHTQGEEKPCSKPHAWSLTHEASCMKPHTYCDRHMRAAYRPRRRTPAWALPLLCSTTGQRPTATSDSSFGFPLVSFRSPSSANGNGPWTKEPRDQARPRPTRPLTGPGSDCGRVHPLGYVQLASRVARHEAEAKTSSPNVVSMADRAHGGVAEGVRRAQRRGHNAAGRA